METAKWKQLFVSFTCYVCITKTYPDINKPLLLPKEYFRETVKRFNPKDLEITDIRASYGNWFNNKTVRGVIDTREDKGSLIPFFIDENKVDKLRKLIEESRETPIIRL